MNADDLEEFSSLLTAASRVLPPCKVLDEAALTMYWMALSDMTIDAFREAVKKSLRQCDFMPAPKQLLELSEGGTYRVRAEMAWYHVDRAVRSVGYYRSPRFDDPVITAVILSMGGWQALCDQSPEQFDQHTRREFLKSYESFAKHGVYSAERLVGYYEQVNGMAGSSRDTCVHIATGYTAPAQKIGNATTEKLAIAKGIL